MWGVELANMPITAAEVANDAAEAIRTLNHLTLGAASYCELDYPCDAYRVLGALALLTARLPQALTQVAAFLQTQLDRGVVVIDGGDHAGDPDTAVHRANTEIHTHAIPAVHHLEDALSHACTAIAWASSTEPAALP